MDKNYESRGTLRTFGIEAALFDAQNNQSVLPIDEIETSLHPKLLEKILFEYLKTPSRSQIIVTRGLNRLSSIREAYRNKRFGATMG